MKSFILLCGIGLSVSPFADGQQPTIAVDRATQERTVRPSGRWLGAVARANRLLPVP